MRHHSMLRWPARILVGTFGLALLTSGISVRAADAPVANAPSGDELARWIHDLDADSFAIREQASNKLREAGRAAVNLLAQAIAGDSAEVSTRASSILQRIADGSDEATLSQVEAALQKISSKRKAVLSIVANIRAQQQKFKHTRAIAQVRAMGGGLTGNLTGEQQIAMAEDILLAVPGPVIMEEEAEIAPAIAIEDLAPRFEAPALEEAPPPPKRGLFGLLARLIVPEAAPAIAPVPPAEFFPVPADIPPDAAIPVEVARAEIEAPAAPAPPDAIPRFEERPELPAPADVPMLIPPIADVAEVEPAEVFVGDDIVMIEPAFAPVPIMIGEMGEGEAYAELTLSKNFRGSDNDLAVLKDIPEIYSLSINGAKLTDAALPHIAALPRLTTLNLRDTPFTSAALRKLRHQRPELSVICRSPAMLGINAGLDGPCVLTSVFFKSGAYDAGLRDGDEILEVDGHKIGSFSDLTIAVYPHQPGDKVNVKFRREDAEKTVEVTLKSRAGVEE
jgi:hypothetical protein